MSAVIILVCVCVYVCVLCHARCCIRPTVFVVLSRAVISVVRDLSVLLVSCLLALRAETVLIK